MKNISLILFLIAAAFSCPGFSVFAAADYRVALVLDKGGRDDKSFNASAYQGAMKAKNELGVQLKYVEAMDDAAIETTIRSFAQKKFDVILAIGFAMTDGVKKIAPLFPDVKFVLVDAEVTGPNVRSVLFEEHQGSFLMGAAAALATKSKKVGFVGGMEVPLIRRFQLGYKAGVEHVNPNATVITNYIGVTSSAWNNPAKAKELAIAQYNQGAEVIFAAAGASNTGVFDAAEEKKKLAIGVDSNQNWVKPGRILTSMLKRVDLAVYNSVRDAKNGKFSAGTQKFGFESEGVDYAMDEHNKNLVSAEMRARLESIKAGIKAGKIQVPDYYKNAK